MLKKFSGSSNFTPCRHDIWKRNTNDRCCEMAGKKMASYYGDTGRMKEELLPELIYPAIDEGIESL